MAVGKPKLTVALALLALATLASTMTYTGFLLIGVLADHLGTGRFTAGLLLAVLFARFPWVRKGKLRVVGLLPKPARRPLILALLGLCMLSLLARGDVVAAFFPGFTAVFLLAYPWLRRAVWARMTSSIFNFAGKRARPSIDDGVIDGEFRERKE